MKWFRTLTVMIGLGFALFAGAATLTNRSIDRAASRSRDRSRIIWATNPRKMRDSQVCKSKMQGEFYTGIDSKVDATVAWYAAHLAGFHKAHAYADGRSQDAFYNDAGTVVVFVTGSPGKEGENTDAYAVTYYRLEPGLSAKTIVSFTQQKVDCR